MARYVLCVDGGGVRGIIIAKILCEIEKRLNKPLGKVFDLFIGSSVGSIIAAGLAVKDVDGKIKYTASDILEFFHKFVPRIFVRSSIRGILSIFSGSRFSPSNLEKALRIFFGDDLISDISAHFMVPTYDLHKQRTCMVRNWIDWYKEVKLVDLLCAASAAPTIFPPRKVGINGTEYLFIDSGLVANNPAVCGCAAADFLYNGEPTYFLSIGSGSQHNGYKRVSDSLLFWAFNVAPIFLDAGMEAVDYQMSRIVRSDRYFRISGALHKASGDFTDASSANIRALLEDADRIIRENSENIDRFVSAVSGK